MAERRSDREDILEAMALYVRSVDDRDLELLGRIFTEDTVWVRDTGPVHGLAAIVANLRSSTARPRPRHIVSSVSVEISGASATAVSDWFLVRPGTPWTIVSAGRYYDELEKRDGRWVFRRREILHLPSE